MVRELKYLHCKQMKCIHLIFSTLKMKILENSLVVQWLGLCLLIAGAWTWPLVGELRPPQATWHSQKKEKSENELQNKIIKVIKCFFFF